MNLEGEPRRYCRKCLLREMESEYFESLQNYIRNLDEDLKVEPEVYEERLAKCQSCDQLFSGMCRLCGCYVELRAVMRKNSCPKVRAEWSRIA